MTEKMRGIEGENQRQSTLRRLIHEIHEEGGDQSRGRERETDTHTHIEKEKEKEKESNSVYSVSMWEAKLIRVGDILNMNIRRTVFRVTQHCHGGVFRVTQVWFRGGLCLTLHN